MHLGDISITGTIEEAMYLLMAWMRNATIFTIVPLRFKKKFYGKFNKSVMSYGCKNF